MKPYLVIIADSFREALASRVLWILLILITLVLVALIPLGFRAEQTTEFRQGDFLDARGLVKAVHRDFDQGSPVARAAPLVDVRRADPQDAQDFQRDDEENRREYYADLPKLIRP